MAILSWPTPFWSGTREWNSLPSLGDISPHETTWLGDAGAFRANDHDSHPKKQASYDSEMCHTKTFPNQSSHKTRKH
jgi:hypothetical protein